MLLEVDGIHAYYGDSHILHGLSFCVEQGEIGDIGNAHLPIHHHPARGGGVEHAANPHIPAIFVRRMFCGTVG